MSKRLYRSRDNEVIGGVCGGVGEFFGIDPTLVRLVWALAFFAGGAGLLAYIVAWFIIPEREKSVRPENPEAIHDLKAAAADLAESGSKVAQEVAEKIRTSVEKLKSEFDDEEEKKPTQESNDSGRMVFGLLFIGFGLFFLARQFLPWIHMRYFWPGLLIIVGLMLILRGTRD